MTIPFSPEELLARCWSSPAGARASTGRSSRIKLGEIEIDILHREVRAGHRRCT